MHIDIDPEYKRLCYIQSIKPGRLNISTILFCILLTIITVGIPLILYWKWQRFKNFIHLLVFQEVQEDSPNINHYLIVDSYKHQGKSRKIMYKNYIVSPYAVEQEAQHFQGIGQTQILKQKQLVKYIEHKHLIYVIREFTLCSAKYKPIKNFQQYFREGLKSDQIDRSSNLYGKSHGFTIQFYHILRKMLHQKHLRLFFMLFAIKKIVFGFIRPQKQSDSKSQLIVSITILAQIVLAWLMMLGVSIFGAKQHNKTHDKIENETTYKVIRNGQQIEVKLKQMYVGDMVRLKVGQIVYFKGILAVNMDLKDYSPYVIVNQKLFNRQDKAVRKIPIQSHLTQIDQINLIYPCSEVLSMDVRKNLLSVTQNNLTTKNQLKTEQNLQMKKQSIVFDKNNEENEKKEVEFFVIVADNNFLRNFVIILIEKYYEANKETNYYDNFQPIRSRYDFQQLTFQAIFFVLALIGTLVVVIDEHTHEHWANLVFSFVVLCFPFNLALFANFSELISIIRLHRKQISVINPNIEEIGMVNNLSMQLSIFEDVQFRGFIKKQKCSGLPVPQGYDDKVNKGTNFFETHKRTKQQSIYAFLAWAGPMNCHRTEKQQLYKEIFDRFGFRKEDSDGFDDQNTNPKITNEDQNIGIGWQEFKRFPISDQLVESTVIKNYRSNKLQKMYFVVSEGLYTGENCFASYDKLSNDHATDQYKDVIQRLFIQGKKIKYLFSKKLYHKQMNQINPDFQRDQIESNSEFAGLLVFDEWLTPENMKNLIQIDTLYLDQEQYGLDVLGFSVREQNALIGYDHILRKTKIFHSMNSESRTEETYMNKADYQGVIYLGHGGLDQGSLLLSDISVNKASLSFAQADFQIISPHQILYLLYEGIWALYNTTITVACLVLFNFSKIIGQLVMFEGDPINPLQPPPLSANIDQLFIIDFGALIVPLFLLNIYEPAPKLVRKDRRNFFRIDLMFHVFISIFGLIVLYSIEFLDHGFRGTCQIYETSKITRSLIQRRSYEHEVFNYQNIHPCQGIVNFITISFSFLVILLIDRQTVERKPRNIFVGMINKAYMFVIWICSIFYFRIPTKNVLRSISVVLILTISIYVVDYLKRKTNAVIQEDIDNAQSFRESIGEEYERVSRRHRSRFDTDRTF